MNYDSTKALAAQIFYLRNQADEMSIRWPTEVQGVRLLGSGAYGAAYALPDGRVLKLGKDIDGTSVWISEAAKHFAATGKPMRHAPRVWAFDTIEYADHVYAITHAGWWAVMEKVESELNRATSANAYCAGLCNRIRLQVLDWAERYNAEFRESLEEDMHAGNWGRSVETGRIVVFDPFAGDCETTPTSTYIDPGQVALKRKAMPPHRTIQHAGPTKGRWARG